MGLFVKRKCSEVVVMVTCLFLLAFSVTLSLPWAKRACVLVTTRPGSSWGARRPPPALPGLPAPPEPVRRHSACGFGAPRSYTRSHACPRSTRGGYGALRPPGRNADKPLGVGALRPAQERTSPTRPFAGPESGGEDQAWLCPSGATSPQTLRCPVVPASPAHRGGRLSQGPAATRDRRGACGPIAFGKPTSRRRDPKCCPAGSRVRSLQSSP